MLKNYSSIAAISSPPGKGGVAIIRVSGEDALELVSSVFHPASGKSFTEAKPRMQTYGYIIDKGERVDDCLATYFPAPRSYTGEDVVEIGCHGGVLVTSLVLETILGAGARHAEAGEFTRRAFINGRLSLTEAEAIGNLLEAQSREQIRLSGSTSRRALTNAVESIRGELVSLMSSIYARIDYPDEDLGDFTDSQVMEALGATVTQAKALRETYRTGRAISEGISAVIVGKPNVGKSSLYNRIIGREAAIVTDVQGTTRDVLTETAALGKVTLRLSDTAGLHDTDDRVEQIGIARAKNELASAELVLALFDASNAPDAEDLTLCEELGRSAVPVIALLNKCDVGEGEYTAFYRERFEHILPISAQTGEGMEQLKALVEELFIDGKLDLRADPVLSNARQHAAAQNARESLRDALSALEAGYPVDVCCTSVENAMAELGELDGRAVSEDLVSEIFSHFCVGK